MAKVNWTFQAMEDLSDIDNYLSEKSKKYAEFVTDEILKLVSFCSNFQMREGSFQKQTLQVFVKSLYTGIA